MNRRGFVTRLVMALAASALFEVEWPKAEDATPADWVNVRDYGAVGDGVTDDTMAIRRAVRAVGQGGTVYFPAGEYVYP